MKAWHFLPEDKKLRYGKRTLVTEGLELRVEPPLVMCKRGLHASKLLMDALVYAPGPVVCRVEVGGEIIKQDDKLVAEKRKVLWMLDATKILHEFACRCAEDALKATHVTDERCWSAISVKRAWVKGEATDDELAAARAAAMGAQNKRLLRMILASAPKYSATR